jgi:hypothetical protein
LTQTEREDRRVSSLGVEIVREWVAWVPSWAVTVMVKALEPETREREPEQVWVPDRSATRTCAWGSSVVIVTGTEAALESK